MSNTDLTVFNETRLNMTITDEHLYPIFHEVISQSNFLTSDLRRDIITKWAAICPNVPLINLKMHLSRVERSFFENLDTIDRNGLRSRILAQQSELNEKVMDSALSIDKKARAIVESNKLMANVAGLSDMAPQVEIQINTNAPIDLTARMNRSHAEANNTTGEALPSD
jgi:hypothetical protein